MGTDRGNLISISRSDMTFHASMDSWNQDILPFVVRRIFASNVGNGRKCRIAARFPRDRASLNSNGVIQLRRVGTGMDKSRDSTMRL